MKRLNHAVFLGDLYCTRDTLVSLDFGSELAKTVVGRLHVPCKVASSGLHFSTLLTRGLSFVHCRVVRQTLVGSEGLFTKVAVELFRLRIPIISYRNNSFSTWWFLFQFSGIVTGGKKP